jgi:hypothetical protein
MKDNHAILLTALVLSLLSSTARAQDAESSTRPTEVSPTAPPGEAPRAVVTTQSDTTRQELDRTRAELDRARAEIEQMRQRVAGGRANPVPAVPEINNLYIGPRSPANSERPLILRTTAMPAEVQANLEEDLRVMNRLFEKALSELPGRPPASRQTAMGIDLSVQIGSAPQRSYFLEGYGAVFVLEAGFPMLVTAPARAEARNPSDGAAASPWEEARREVYGQPPQGPPAAREISTSITERLKRMLLDALKNASNIRDLKPEESVTVCVLGGGYGGPVASWASVGGTTYMFPSPAGGGAGSTTGSSYGSYGPGGRDSAQHRTIMTLQVKKADADALAKGEITGEEFGNRARIATYSSGDRAPTSPDRAGRAFEYTVQPGDTLTTVLTKVRAKNPGITGEQLMRANPGLRPNRLVAGEKIVIPLPQ